MRDAPVPTGAADLTPAWLTAVLGGDGAGEVVAVEAEPIGTGQVADSFRLRLTWAGGAGPPTVAVKVTAASETSRQAAAATRTYEVEVGFYRDLAASLPVRAPACHWAGYEAETCAYAVVLEDVAPAVAGDQLAGCTVEEAALALQEAALLHGPRWGDPSLLDIGWLARHQAGDGGGGGMGGFAAALAPGFLERYAARLSPDVVALTERFVARITDPDRPLTAHEGPLAVVHGDFRNDNLMFGGPRVVVLDWQTVGLGDALADVSYFLGGSLLPDDRRAHEESLVRNYWERLAGHGVDLGWDDAWRRYRRNAFGGLTMAVIASMLVQRTDRGDEMFIAMAERAGRHALDLEAESLL
jgi:hypothetical protein